MLLTARHVTLVACSLSRQGEDQRPRTATPGSSPTRRFAHLRSSPSYDCSFLLHERTHLVFQDQQLRPLPRKDLRSSSKCCLSHRVFWACETWSAQFGEKKTGSSPFILLP